MSRKRIVDIVNLDPTFLDINNWPMVNILKLSEEDSKVYKNRELAVRLYMHDKSSLQEIKEQTGIDAKEIRDFVRRCLTYDPDTSIIWGFRALIPRKRITNYKRKSKTKSNHQESFGLNGAFKQLLRNHPDIDKIIKAAYLRRRESNVKRPKLSGNDIHRIFLNQCKLEGIGLEEYPFNTEDKAFRSLYRYFKEIEQEHFSEAAKLYGEESAKSARWKGNKTDDDLLLNRPYQRVQFDGHKIDAMFTISFTTPEGDIVTEVIERIWLLVIVDVATRAILGHHLCLNKEYNLDDVLHCIRNSIIPYEQLKLTIPGLTYHPDGGLPSAEIPQVAWALWNEFSIDNGKPNLANQVKDRLYQVVGCTVNPGPVSTPEVRGIIERLFRSLEVMGYHKLMSTTGSNPSDPIRNNPEHQAKKYNISINDLEELTHVLISDYNGIPNSGVRNLTPLQVMKQRIERGMEPRLLEPEKRREAVFFSLQTKRMVNGDITQGKRPFIYFEGVPYRNDVLSNSANLIGQELTLLVNTDDIRIIRASFSDGSELGYLMAYGIWGIVPHSLRTRKAINKLKKNRKIFFNQYQNPFEVYHEYITQKAKTNKSERNKLAQFQREIQAAEKEREEMIIESVETTTYQENHPNWNSITLDEENNRPFRTYNL
ncbi:hypothetical protein [Cohnella sp. JJ-181]|uniref:hypothetical protein n=1 Tax=Cohnella rhizoplanae TaxID=2974897 RepID=UPI0022FF9AC6|nr:hypothetical protein [Cohnella sp. JJ-181]CAI6087639.1 hypothetical protein COHCIP112018_05626 [Cohnella sp. JJ-181]